MKQRILVCLILALTLVLGLCGAASAAGDDPITLYMELSTDRFSGPSEVTVNIRVTNSSDETLPSAVTLYYPDETPIPDFEAPALAPGASASWTGTWQVTQEQLASGRLTFSVTYPVSTGDDVVMKRLNFYRPIVDAGAVAELTVNRTIAPTMARKGQEVSVIYELINTGTVDVTDVVIQESSTVTKTNGKVAQVKAGEKAVYTFTVTMGTKNLTSNAKITYKAGGKTYTDSKPNATIKYGDVKLNATLAADKKGGNPGETVKLTLTLKNTGKADYENVTVTDALLGTLFTGETVKAGETRTLEKEITIAQSAEYLFSVSGTDASGATIATATGRVAVTAVDPAKVVNLTVNATADSETIYIKPGVVKFTVDVTNTSEVKAESVSVSASGVTLYTFDTIEPGQTRSFSRDVLVETPGKFRFDAKVKNQLSETVAFESNVVQIVYASPTAVPTMVPIAAPPTPDYELTVPEVTFTPGEELQLSILGAVVPVSLVLAVIFGVLSVVGIVGRIVRAANAGKAVDRLERDGYRDYTQAVSAKERHEMPEEAVTEAPAEAPVTEAPEAEEPETPAEPEAAPAEEAAPAQDTAMEDAMEQLYPRVTRASEDAAARRRRDEE